MDPRFSSFRTFLTSIQKELKTVLDRVRGVLLAERGWTSVCFQKLKTKSENEILRARSFSAQRLNFSENELGGLALADAVVLFLAPLITAALFEPNFSHFSSGFLLKTMAVFALNMTALFVCCGFYKDLRKESLHATRTTQRSKKWSEPFLRTQTPTLSKTTSDKKAKTIKTQKENDPEPLISTKTQGSTKKTSWVPPQTLEALFVYVGLGSALVYPFERMLEQLEHFSSFTPLLHLFVTYLLLLPQRFVLLHLHTPTKPMAQEANPQTFPILAHEPLKVLLVGTLPGIQAFLHRPTSDSTRQRFEPIAAVTSHALDFGRYVEDVPIVGDVCALPELIRAESTCPSFQCLFLLDDVVPSEVLCTLEGVAKDKGLSILTLKSTEESVVVL